VTDSIKHERDLLAQAIQQAAVKAGICHPDVSLTGPQLLLLANDMAELLCAAKSGGAYRPAPRVVVMLVDGVVSDVVADHPVKVVSVEFDEYADKDELIQIPTKDGDEKAGTASVWEATVHPERVIETVRAAEVRTPAPSRKP
jgi:hypothetical protein